MPPPPRPALLGRRHLLRAGLLSVAGLAAGCADRTGSEHPPPGGSPSAQPPPLRTTPPVGATDRSAPTEPTAIPAPTEPEASATEQTAPPEPATTGEPATQEQADAPAPDPTPPAGPAAVAVLCRDAWDARPPAPGGRSHRIAQITVHHSAVVLGDNRRAPDRLLQHQRYHQDSRGWIDIAYHFGVDRAGNVYELRATGLAGDTGTDYDPAGHLLLLAEGDFDREQPTDAQLSALADVAAAGIGAHGLAHDLDRVLSGHRDHASTSCPGDALYARMAELRDAVARRLTSGGAQLQPWCGPDASAHVADVRAGRA